MQCNAIQKEFHLCLKYTQVIREILYINVKPRLLNKMKIIKFYPTNLKFDEYLYFSIRRCFRGISCDRIFIATLSHGIMPLVIESSISSSRTSGTK